MLVGVGGSGKQSLTRFASFVAEMKCFSDRAEPKGTGTQEFRDDLKKLCTSSAGQDDGGNIG